MIGLRISSYGVWKDIMRGKMSMLFLTHEFSHSTILCMLKSLDRQTDRQSTVWLRERVPHLLLSDNYSFESLPPFRSPSLPSYLPSSLPVNNARPTTHIPHSLPCMSHSPNHQTQGYCYALSILFYCSSSGNVMPPTPNRMENNRQRI